MRSTSCMDEPASRDRANPKGHRRHGQFAVSSMTGDVIYGMDHLSGELTYRKMTSMRDPRTLRAAGICAMRVKPAARTDQDPLGASATPVRVVVVRGQHALA